MKNMLGEIIAEYRGKVIGQRVLDVEGPTMETSVSAGGNIKGAQVSINITYIARPASAGILHGKGKGVIMAGTSEMATETGEGIGVFSSSGVKWRGAIFYRTQSTGRLASINNAVGVFEADVDTDGNFSLKSWEWK